MDRISAPEQNRLLGRLADMLRMTEGQAAAPEFLPPQLNVMNLVRQLMLPSAETVEKMSYGDPLFRMPQQSRIPITADKGYLADIAGMVPFAAPAARPSARAMQDLVREIQTTPPVGAISPEIAAKVIPETKVVDEAGNPKLLYHGTPKAFEDFQPGRLGAVFASPDPKFASKYAGEEYTVDVMGETPNVRPVYIDAKNPFDYENPSHVSAMVKWLKENNPDFRDVAESIGDKVKDGFYYQIERPIVQDAIRSMGFDGFYIKEGGAKNIAVFDPKQIKSAISDPQMAGLLDQPTQKTVEAPKFEMPSFARLKPDTSEDIDKIYDYLEERAKKAGYKIETGSSNVSGSRYLTIYEDLPNDDIRSIELRVSNHADRHPVSYADERISIDPFSVDLEEALYMLEDKGYNLFRK